MDVQVALNLQWGSVPGGTVAKKKIRVKWAIASSRTRFLITHKDASQSVGLLWTSDQSIPETSP